MILYARPYNGDHMGFQFSSLTEYESGVLTSGAEEFEITLIGGDFNSAIFDGMKVSQCNIEESFEISGVLEGMGEEQLTAVEFLLDCGHDINYALDVCITEESLDDYAYSVMTDCYEVPENLIHYLDYRAFGRDLRLEGAVVELNGFLITNANDF